ncbi:MAG: hemolysin III family protein [Gemmatimonadetes bacterium]|nr:hemolysin III family protein [Gemmatimonadota bacterium]MDA1104513.1 hemolysin III family protein [Gemmatimonadota bacterium]
MTPREELANSLSHGVGLAGAIAATPILIVGAVARGGAADIVGSSVFGFTMIVMYFASTWYHATLPGTRKDRLRRFDHAAIYLLIAGSYTPFTLGVLGGAWGWTLFGVVWGAAAIGVGVKTLSGVSHPRVSTAMYLIMGWSILIAIRPLTSNMPPEGLRWLVAGGLCYSGGVVFFALRGLPYNHLVWHLFVLAGSTCHFFGVLWYAT